jgi:DNA-binding protein H-NS
MNDQVEETGVEDAPVDAADKPKTNRLNFAKRASTAAAETIADPAIAAAATDEEIDDDLAPLPPSTLTSALAITPDEADKFDDTAPDPEPEPVLETVPELMTEEEAVHAIPFDLEDMGEVLAAEAAELEHVKHVPNEETVAALEEVAAGETTQVESVDQLVADASGDNEDDGVEEIDEGEAEAVDDEPAEEAAPESDEPSIEELEAQKQELESTLLARKEAEKKEVCAQIVQVMGQYTIDIDYLAAYMGVKYKRRGSKAKPKYRDPMTGKTWSGRGKTPVWIRGKDPKQFLI